MSPANVDAIHAFLDAVAACKGEVFLKSREGDVFNSEILSVHLLNSSSFIDLLLHSTTTATASIGINFKS